MRSCSDKRCRQLAGRSSCAGRASKKSFRPKIKLKQLRLAYLALPHHIPLPSAPPAASPGALPAPKAAPQTWGKASLSSEGQPTSTEPSMATWRWRRWVVCSMALHARAVTLSSMQQRCGCVCKDHPHPHYPLNQVLRRAINPYLHHHGSHMNSLPPPTHGTLLCSLARAVQTCRCPKPPHPKSWRTKCQLRCAACWP